MKRTSFFVALLLPCALAAQTPTNPTDKGSMIVDGFASFGRSGGDGPSATHVSINPEVLFFVAPGVAVGGSLGLSHTSNEGSSSDFSSWVVGPALKYFFVRGDEKTLPFVGAMIGFGKTSSSSNFELTQTRAEATGGLTWMLARHVGLIGEAYFMSFTTKIEDTSAPTPIPSTTSNDLGVRFRVSAFVF